ncbi:MAG TPA: glycoside hydrolase family 38 C-terminal domain-containing protein [Candidatus Saccharimonadales bacterium]|jgi:alpha-mannosidase|nr:glycoside hydrolase family 38 C-terminal domain-containing protein [Candidatus Saccharimonadales bacterium]
MLRTIMLSMLLALVGAVAPNAAQTTAPEKPAAAPTPTPAPDLNRQKTLYAVGYAHLDTQWRWEYPQVINEYLTKTMRSNFALFEKYPHYIFNFTGANRYRLMKEYFPEDFALLKHYVAAGRWFPAGSSMEEGDVNSPNAESIFRQVLYGNQFFRREFGKASAEYMLPDCFGFPASLPSILHHAGMKGFSTQKLSSGWQPAPHVGGPDSPEKTPEGIPFNVGLWEGPDGHTILAALNPLSYTSQVTYDLSKNPPPPPPPDPALTAQQNQSRARPQEDWVKRIQTNGSLTGIFADFHYVGTGDVGGSPNESSVKLMEDITTQGKASHSVNVGDGPVRVVWSRADQMFLDIGKCCKTDRLPRYKGDLELINHSAGSLTSEAYQKRWNRKNELLADAAEKASLVAAWLGGRAYPLERLNNAWTLVMGGQFHDLLPGTATPKAFEFAWNDEVLAMNQFAGVLTSATSSVAAGMDTATTVQGTPVVVYNPLNVEREDVVEAELKFSSGAPKAVRVFAPDGREVPSQVAGASNGLAKVLFLARTPSVGYAVYDVRSTETAAGSELKVSESALENFRYRVQLDQNGDVSSIFDKKLKRELLAAPVRLAISTDNPRQWPAWNMDFEDEQRAPKAFAGGPARVRVVENGAARVAVEVVREAEGSRFAQTIRLSAGDAGNRVEFSNVIDWKTRESNLKASFSFSAANSLATYNWDVGTVQRPNENERQFEVASHQWIDLTDQSGAFGVTVLTDCKNASDKPSDNTLRLTLVRTPGTRGGYADQGTQDLGHHEIVYGLAGHEADWRQAQTDWHAYRMNQPLIAFESPRHPGALGRSLAWLKLNNSRIRVLAMKKAEQSDEVIVRLVEIDGRPAKDVRLAFAAPVTAAREVNGQEQPAGAATVKNGELVTSFTPYQLHTFALRLAPATRKVMAPRAQPVSLTYDLSVATRGGRAAEGCFDCSFERPTAPQGKALPAEMLPGTLDYAGIHFNLTPAGKPDAVSAHGQTISLPPGKFNRVYMLAAAAGGDQKATFRAGDQAVELNIQEWTGFIGQWDDRIWRREEQAMPQRPGSPAPPPGTTPRVRINEYAEMLGLRPGFIKRSDVAWFSTHRHDSSGANEAYAYSYLFVYAIDLPEGAHTLTLPENDRIRILAMSVADGSAEVHPVQPLYDTLVP